MNYKKKYKIEEINCEVCSKEIIDRISNTANVLEVLIDLDNNELTVVSSMPITDDKVHQAVEEALKSKEHNLHIGTFSNIITEEYTFDDIDCPNCAAKLERALNNQKDIVDAQVNFITKKIYIKHHNNVEIYNLVTKVVKSVSLNAKVKKQCNCCDHEHHEHKHEHHHTHDNNCSCSEHVHHEHKLEHHHDHDCNCSDHNHNHHNHHKHFDKHNHKHSKTIQNIGLAISIIGFFVFIITMYLESDIIGTNYPIFIRILYVVAYLLIAYDLLIDAVNNIIHKDFFNEKTLMLLASIGALAINESIEGIMVVLLYKIGEYFQDRATEKSRNAIKDLMDLKVDKVTLKDGTEKDVKDIIVGDIITIKVGERIPLDGIVKEGSTSIDMKALTGESVPIDALEGEEILSGSINLSKVIDIEVTKTDNESTISKVMKLVEEATNHKSKSEKFITKFARIYTIIILIVALLVAIVQLAISVDFVKVMNNTFTILVIACPCALVISIPLGYFAGIGLCSKNGILVKGGNFLEALTNVETFVFDKTGTITKGNFKVLSVNPVEGTSKEELLKIVSIAEYYSNHPIAASIKNEYGKEIELSSKATIEEFGGKGLRVTDDGVETLVGNARLLNEYKIVFSESNEIGSILYVAQNGKYLGNIVIGDELKEESTDLFKYLNKKKYNTVILTGDNEAVANDISSKLGVTKVYSKLLPQTKYNILKDIIKHKNKNVVYVGDGINDTPALKLSDIGISMGTIGSDSAKEASDIVIVNDDISKISDAITYSKFTKRIVMQNIIMCLSIKIITLIIGVLGIFENLGMIFAIFADVGTCLLAIFNVMRILYYKKKNNK